MAREGDAPDNNCPPPPRGWVPLKEHLEALRAADDRRYSEVAQEREKALKIKEEADKVAQALARRIQAYKDEQGNELRAQINSERGLYPTKTELAAAIDKLTAIVRPLAEYVVAQQGRREGIGLTTGALVGSLTAFATVVTVIIILVDVVSGG